MTPAEVCKTAKLPPGFELQAFASEPDIQNPIAITTDARGRLWVAENYTWAGADAGDFDSKLRDRVVILEDTDGDGKHDKRTVFFDKATRLTSLEVGMGGVWLMCSPQLLFIPDRNRNDVPDGPPEVVLDGFDIAQVSHTVANGLKWGPDGWLYGRQGILGTSKVGTPGTADDKRFAINTGIWRVHPTTHKCETVMHGMTNPWGFDYDAYGEMFVINTVIGHLWHVIPGGRTERMFGTDFNPHAYQLLSQVADHVHWHTSESWNDVDMGVTDRTSAAGGGHAHTGLMIYQGNNWPADYQGRVLTLNLHGRRLNTDNLIEKAVGYTATHNHDMCFIADPFFRGMDIIAAADGSAFIADWSDTGECHEMGGVHRTSGRIYKLKFGTTPGNKPFDLTSLSDEELAKLQTHKNDWHARQSRRVLQERAARGTLNTAAVRKRLLAIFNDTAEPVNRCRALWALVTSQCVDTAWLLDRLDDRNEHVRVWAIRFLIEGATESNAADRHALVNRLSQMAASDQSGLVLLYLASTLQKLPVEERWPIAQALLSRAEPTFNTDRTLSIMIWLGIEPLVASEPSRTIELLPHMTFPLVRENTARRIALDIDKNVQPVEQLLTLAEQQPQLAPSLIRGVAEALSGRKDAPVPANWTAFATSRVVRQDVVTVDAIHSIGVVLKDKTTIDELRKIAGDAKTEAGSRQRALELLTMAAPSDLPALLRELIKDRDLATTAIRGVARFDDPAAAEEIIGIFSKLTPEARSAAVDTLVSRSSYANKLLRAIEAKQIVSTDVSAFQVRQLNALNDAGLSEKLRELWGDVRETPQEKRSQIAHLRHTFGGGLDSANLENGKAVFNKTCATCHVLLGEGKPLGPDLTGSNRKNLDYLLENIIDPSAVVGADFRANVYYLADGRTLTGVVKEKTDRTITIATPEGFQTIDQEEIDEVQDSSQSMMPDGLLQTLNETQIRDLLGYLMSN